MIAGGFVGGGCSMVARKKHLRNSRTIMTIGGMPKSSKESAHGRNATITFSDEDLERVEREGDDPMVISVITKNFILKRVLVDQGSSADILYEEAFKKLGLTDKLLKPFPTDLVGFAG